MKLITKTSIQFMFILMFSLATGLFAQTSKSSTADEVIALTYKIWKAEMDKNTMEMNKYLSDDYTEFNSDYSTRIDGKKTNVALYDVFIKEGGIELAAEMLNPKVQVYGDVAILSYNYAGIVRDNGGKIINTKAKSTRVYAKINGDWKLVHANFGYDPGNN